VGKPKFRDRVAGAYVEIANRLNTKTPMTLRIADMYLGDLQKYFGKQLYDEKIIFAFAVVTTRDEAPDGDRVVLSKPRDGLLAVLPKGYVAEASLEGKHGDRNPRPRRADHQWGGRGVPTELGISHGSNLSKGGLIIYPVGGARRRLDPASANLRARQARTTRRESARGQASWQAAVEGSYCVRSGAPFRAQGPAGN
jgi:hypothetical protein